MFWCDHHGNGSKKCTCDFCKYGIVGHREALRTPLTFHVGWANQFQMISIIPVSGQHPGGISICHEGRIQEATSLRMLRSMRL